MGEIVAFRTPKPVVAVPPSGGAEILFFTGVRYQRGIEGAASPCRAAPAAAGRQRGGAAEPSAEEGAEPQQKSPCHPAPSRYQPRRDTSPQREAPI